MKKFLWLILLIGLFSQIIYAQPQQGPEQFQAQISLEPTFGQTSPIIDYEKGLIHVEIWITNTEDVEEFGCLISTTCDWKAINAQPQEIHCFNDSGLIDSDKSVTVTKLGLNSAFLYYYATDGGYLRRNIGGRRVLELCIKCDEKLPRKANYEIKLYDFKVTGTDGSALTAIKEVGFTRSFRSSTYPEDNK